MGIGHPGMTLQYGLQLRMVRPLYRYNSKKGLTVPQRLQVNNYEVSDDWGTMKSLYSIQGAIICQCQTYGLETQLETQIAQYPSRDEHPRTLASAVPGCAAISTCCNVNERRIHFAPLQCSINPIGLRPSQASRPLPHCVTLVRKVIILPGKCAVFCKHCDSSKASILW